MKKLMLYKFIILLLGGISLFFLYTGSIYMYENLSIKFLSPSLWFGVILWGLFLINALILTYYSNKKEKNEYSKFRNILRNIILLMLMTILLVYKIGGSVLELYKISNHVFNTVIYVVFALIFVGYLIVTIILNRKEDSK